MKDFNALTNAKECFSIILYLRSTCLNALLKKAIGWSKPSWFFWSKIVDIVSSEANEKVINS